MPDVSIEDVILPKETKERVCESVLKFPAIKDKFNKLEVDRKITYGCVSCVPMCVDRVNCEIFPEKETSCT